MPDVNVGDFMNFNGTPLYYTGSGWTSNTPGSLGNPATTQGAKITNDPWGGLNDGEFNAAGYGATPAAAPVTTPTTAATPATGLTTSGASRGVPPAPASTPRMGAPATVLGSSNPQTFGPDTGWPGTGSYPNTNYVPPTLRSNNPGIAFNANAGSAAQYNPVVGAVTSSVPRGTAFPSTAAPATTANGPGQNNLPPGYYSSTGPGGTFNPQGAPTFETYWQQKLAELQSPMTTPQAWVSGIQGYSLNNPVASMTPAAQWASEYVSLHPDDPAIAQAGGADAFVNKYNTSQYSLQTLRPDLAAVSNGYGSGVSGAWKGLGDSGAKLLTYGVDQGMQPAYDSAPSDILRSLQLNGISPNSAVGQRALSNSNYNLANGINTGAKAIGATPYVNQNGTLPQGFTAGGGGTASGTQQTTPTTPTTPTTTPTQTPNQYDQLIAALQQLLGSNSTSQVGTTPLGYTQYTNPANSSNDQTLQTLMALISVLGQTQPRQTDYWNF